MGFTFPSILNLYVLCYYLIFPQEQSRGLVFVDLPLLRAWAVSISLLDSAQHIPGTPI